MITPETVITINQDFNDDREPWIDRAMLDSAFSSYMYYDDEIEQLCSIFRGLIKNHAFSNGNKRTASLILGSQLMRIGLQTVPGALADLALDVASNDYDIPAIAQKLRKILRPVQVGIR